MAIRIFLREKNEDDIGWLEGEENLEGVVGGKEWIKIYEK